jgi:hypothetical protein
MLVQFKLSNYRSFAQEQVLSLVPSSSKTDFEQNILKNENGKYSFLNGLAIYGPNSSGKSNLLNAIKTLSKMIFSSNKTNSTTDLPYDPNLLVEGYRDMPTTMELVFVAENVRYRYGLSYNKEIIVSEYLFRKKSGREVELFFREKGDIEVSSGLTGKMIRIEAAIESTRDNSLFLSSCDQFNIAEATIIFGWLKKLIVIDGLDTSVEEVNTLELLEQDSFRDDVNKYLHELDLGFTELEVQKKSFDVSDLSHTPEDPGKADIVKQIIGQTGPRMMSRHDRYKPDGSKLSESVSWGVDERESSGTLKAIHLSGPIIFALRNGSTLIVDEIEAKMHTKLTKSIISLFLNPEINKFGSQIIFSTHDTNLLDALDLRRDQIYFVEKGNIENSELYSLSDIVYADGKKERKETDKERRYLEDRYGATPDISPTLALFLTEG